MRRTLLISLSLAAVAGATFLLGAHSTPASAQADDSTELRAAIQQIMTKLYKTKKGLRPELTNSQVAKKLKGAASIVGGYMVSLEKTQYAPDGDWSGVITLYADTDEPREQLGDFDLALLCDDYDKDKMERWLLSVAGPEIGLALERDEEEESLYYAPEPKRRDIWISLGEGVIQFSTSVVED